jgi:hypothetical protein
MRHSPSWQGRPRSLRAAVRHGETRSGDIWVAAGAQVALLGRNVERLKRMVGSIEHRSDVAHLIVRVQTEEMCTIGHCERGGGPHGFSRYSRRCCRDIRDEPLRGGWDGELRRANGRATFGHRLRSPSERLAASSPEWERCRSLHLVIGSALAAFPEASAYSRDQGSGRVTLSRVGGGVWLPPGVGPTQSLRRDRYSDEHGVL